ncbi:hypothetical protein ACFQZX_13045 [Mucilaginibacter litoreus]|uniref:Uncharacterized protein n=1 Tax=Mucilaginibacter litoreus TaxID=1048221 RepID=A0ABW3AU10_9SPHI
MKKIYISAVILAAVAITEGCVKLRVANTNAPQTIVRGNYQYL